MNDTIKIKEIYLNAKSFLVKAVLICLFLYPLSALFILGINGPPPIHIKIIGFVLLAIGLLIPPLFFLAEKNRRYMQTIVSDVGLTIPVGGKRQLTIDWNDIEYVTPIHDGIGVGIKIKDPEKYTSMMELGMVGMAAMNLNESSSHGCIFSIICSWYGMKASEIIELIQPYLKPNQSNNI